MAEQEQVQLLTRSVDEWNQWLQQYPDIRPDLSGADLSGTDLSGAYLFWANLSEANLKEADLSGAYLNRAALFETNLRGANLSETNLRRARLIRANLSYANLTKAILKRADLCACNLSYANLTEVDFSEAHFFHTTFASVNLNGVKGLETAVHNGPSIVDVKSVTLPYDEDIRRHFLRNTGFPDSFIEYLRFPHSIHAQHDPLFLSYSHYDEEFAQRLYNDLQNQGVRCWFCAHYLYPSIVQEIREAIDPPEKLLLILSTNTIASDWIQQEVESALDKEGIIHKEVIYPLCLDNSILECDTCWAECLRQRHMSDFTDWQDDAAYQQALTALLQEIEVIKSPPFCSVS